MERDLYPRSSEASEHTMLQFHGKSRPQIIASLVGKIHIEVKQFWAKFSGYTTHVCQRA